MKANLPDILKSIRDKGAELIAVSKTRSVPEIMSIYNQGVRDFGENRIQELLEKKDFLPADIRWHVIGHLQTNKVKHIASFAYCIHSVDSQKLLNVIDREAFKIGQKIKVFLQIKIAREDTKFGLSQEDARIILKHYEEGQYPNVEISGFMGMATFTEDEGQILEEFRSLRDFRDEMALTYKASGHEFKDLSMGMSDDYEIALREGSTMVRIGTLIFGPRT